MDHQWTGRWDVERRILRMLLVATTAIVIGLSGGQAAAFAQDSSPDIQSQVMAGLFGLVPATMPGVEDESRMEIHYANIEAQLKSMGIPTPQDLDAPFIDAWFAATRDLALPPTPAQHFAKFREDFAFDLLQADQTLTVLAHPSELSMYRGRFDHDAIRAQLASNGYQLVTVGGHELLAIRGDYETDVKAPAFYALDKMNFAAILDDGTLVFASTGDAVAAVLDVVAGAAPSMMDVAGSGTLLSQAPADLVSAVVVHGDVLMSDPFAGASPEPTAEAHLDAIGTETVEQGETQPVVMAMLGFTAGGPLVIGEEALQLPPESPDARALAIVLAPSPQAAVSTAPVIEERLSTGVWSFTGDSYSEIFSDWSVEAVEQKPAVIVEFALTEGTPPGILIDMLYMRDLGFLSW